MKWFLLFLVYLLVTFKVALDSTEYRYHKRTVKDVTIAWIGAILAIPLFFLVVISFLKVTA